MTAFAAGVAAAFAAYIINRFIIERAGNKGIVSFIPIVEELLKSLAAVYLGASIISAHLVFGAVESGYELKSARNIKGVVGGISSLVAHGLLGLVTAVVWKWTDSLFLGIGASAMLHSVWNRIITRTYTGS